MQLFASSPVSYDPEKGFIKQAELPGKNIGSYASIESSRRLYIGDVLYTIESEFDEDGVSFLSTYDLRTFSGIQSLKF